MNKPLQRFDFGALRDFRGPISFTSDMPVMPEAVEPPPPPPPPTYSEDQLQQARIEAKKMGYQEGFAAGLSQANAETESRQIAADEAMKHIAAQIGGLAGQYMQILEAQSSEVSELALLIARKVAEQALSERGVEAIVSMVGRCLPVIYLRPRLVVELNPETLPVAEARLKTLLREEGFEGELQFRANPALGVSDTRLDWGNGAAERSEQALWKQIEALLGRMPIGLELTQPTAAITGE